MSEVTCTPPRHREITGARDMATRE